MLHSRYSSDEIARHGEEVYEQPLRTRVEIEANIGKIISIDIETRAYEIDEDLLATGRRLRNKSPDAALWTKRIGYNAVFAVGGTLTRTAA